MKLSAPIHHLKRRAKAMARKERIALHEALDRVARIEGFSRWSLLAAQISKGTSASELLAKLRPGDMLLLGARPGHGKTLMGMELIAEAMKSGRQGVFLSLECVESDVLDYLNAIGGDAARFNERFTFDNSDAISSDYIVEQLSASPRGTVAVIDYLQLLDQRRENPVLAEQVRALKSFAEDKGLIFVFISQIDRSYLLSARPCPDMRDVRLPNPVDLKLFDLACFLQDGRAHIASNGV
ncbi:DNA helicase [Hoeflea prorocentri]|uniref:DNA helicase n=1 Tax=Hoeflea prorocentri TaxID=1922333 RepID=A0A9X3UQ73_9HYPH|nr:DNA helicase [Hoeflea prorocentri]MCY6383359.1 DNA helicase [Hoeflea prorocentri]MDA5401159.1 DNA helicase [Hoeflea prorocentri]